jgi:O-antigen ligase
MINNNIFSIGKDKIIYTFSLLYVFFSGIVFIEPSPAEIIFVLFFPFLFYFIEFKKSDLYLFLIVFLPAIISFYIGGMYFGYFNLKFFLIDVYIFLLFLFLYKTFIYIFSKRDLFDKIIKSWGSIATLNILLGFYAYATKRFQIGSIEIVGFGIRLIGLFKDPNVLGPFIIPLALYYFEKFYYKKTILKNTILFSFMSIGVFLSFSRAAWLSYFIGVFFIVFLYSIKNKNVYNWKTILFLFLLVLIIVFLFMSNIKIGSFSFNDFLKSRIGIKSYDRMRFASQDRAFDMIYMSRLFGIGPGNYEFVSGFSAHSTFLRYIGERGFFGIITFIYFLIFIFYKSLKLLNTNKTFLIASYIGIIFNSFFVDTLHWRHMWVLFALILALSNLEENIYEK